MNPPPQPAVPAPPCLAPSPENTPWTPPPGSHWFTDHVQPHESNLRKWLCARFPRLRDVDDLIHDAYVKLFRAHASGQVKDPRTYLYSTARNAALDRYRHDSVIAFEPLIDDTLREDIADSAAATARQEEIKILQDAIAALPERCRRVFTLRKIYGLTHVEIAQKLKIAEGTVEAQVNIAMRRCTAYLHDRGLP